MDEATQARFQAQVTEADLQATDRVAGGQWPPAGGRKFAGGLPGTGGVWRAPVVMSWR